MTTAAASAAAAGKEQQKKAAEVSLFGLILPKPDACCQWPIMAELKAATAAAPRGNCSRQ
jgi:hypothetical protein